MKKNFPLIAVILVALISIAIYFSNREGLASTDFFHSDKPDTKQRLSQTRFEAERNNTRVKRDRPAGSGNDSRESEMENLRSELKTAKAELEILSGPLTEEMLSTTVNAEISPGDTLVTGGYKTADGNYEMTFITPRSVTLSDGSEGVEIRSQVLSVGPEFVENNGMGTLATNAGNTLQHGESWKPDDIKTTFASASQNPRVNVLSTPTIITPQSSPFDLIFGEEGGAQFSIRGTVEKNAAGNFLIKSRVERKPGIEPDSVENP